MRRRSRRRGFKLIDLMVVIAVISIMLGLGIEFLRLQRWESGCTCRAQCQNNLRNVGLGLVQYYTLRNVYPNAGTFFDNPEVHRGDPLKSSIYTALVNPAAFASGSNPCGSSWVVEILPYLDNQELYNAWNFKQSYLSQASPGPALTSNAKIAGTTESILHCPNDDTTAPSSGNLSYVVNGGFARWYAVPLGWNGGVTPPGNDGVLQWHASGDLLRLNLDIGRKLGVMFLGTHTGDQPWDIKTRPQDITDGASTTLLLGENLWTGHSTGTTYSGGLPTNWACPLPTFAMFLASDNVCHSAVSTTDCLAGQLRSGSNGATGPGWSRANKRGTFENINGKAQLPTEGGYPYISSNHPGGANFVFCDGSVKFLSETIDGTVYAQIITPGGESLPWSSRHGTMNGEDITN